MTGGVLSSTTIERLQVAVLPQSSVAVQVRVAVYVPAHEPGVVVVINEIATVASHASVAVALTQTGKAGQLTGDTWSTHVIVGGVLSLTTIDWLQVDVLPQSSVAVHVRVAVYVPAHEPGVELSTCVTVTVASHASVAVASIQTGVLGQSIGVVCATQVIVGGVLSRTTIERLQVAVLPQSSVAVQVRVAVYVPAHEPGVDPSTCVMMTVASQASKAVASIQTGVFGQSIGLIGSTHIIVGGVLSLTTIDALQVAVLPQSSVAVQVRVAVYVPKHVPGVVAVVNATVTSASHRSVAVAFTHSGVAGQLIGVTCA